MSLKEYLNSLLQRPERGELPDRFIEDWLAHCLGVSWSQLKINGDQNLSEEKRRQVEVGLEKLFAGYPLAYLIGEIEFYGLPFKVGPGVLIPRPETELLVERALQLINDKAVVYDLGAGSGCIGLSIAKKSPQSKVYLFEKEAAAARCCEANKVALSIENAEIISAAIPTTMGIEYPQADVVIANPPYIAHGDPRVTDSVFNHEPHSALFAQDNGLAEIKAWAQWAYQTLKPGGDYLFEFGLGQDPAIADFIATTDYDIIDIIEDLSGRRRFFQLRK